MIGCVGHLRAKKGHDSLVQAFGQLVDSGLDVHLARAGEGSLLAKLKETAKALGCEQRVHFLGRRSDITHILSGCDIFVFAMQFGALGTSFIEASVCGFLVVETNVGGVPEVIREGETGFLVPYGSVPALANALATLVKDSGLRESMGQSRRGRHPW